MQFPNWIRAALQKTVLFSSSSGSRGGAYAIRPYNRVRMMLRNTDAMPQPGTCDPSKYRCNFPTGYVRSFKKLSRFRPHRGRWVGVCDTLLRLGTCEGSKNGSVYATVGGVWWGVCNTPLQPGTYDPSKYRCDSPTGYVWPFKKLSCFRPLRGRLWGVCNTPLQLGTCDSSKYRCNFPTGYVRGFKKWICIRHRRWRMVGRMRYAPTAGYVRPFEIPMRSLDWRGRGVWEVGRWGLPLAGEVGVNEFGEKEDDDQNNDNKGA